jgi:hypothetical protein
VACAHIVFLPQSPEPKLLVFGLAIAAAPADLHARTLLMTFLGGAWRPSSLFSRAISMFEPYGSFSKTEQIGRYRSDLKVGQHRVGHAFWVVQALMCLNQKVAQGINSRAGALRDRYEGRRGRR